MMNFIFNILICSVFVNSYGKRPNVLFIIVDDLRPALGAYGDPNSYTPNIDKLARNSFVFTNTFAQQALCAPSRNSLLTSRRPDSLHLYDFYSYWRNTVGNFTTLPQHFRDNDYVTHSIGKVFHIGESSNKNDDVPFSWSLPPFHPRTNKYKDAPVCLTRTGERKANLLCPVLVDDQPLGTLPDLEILQEAQEFLQEYNKNGGEKSKTNGEKHFKGVLQNEENVQKPYFLAVGFHKPHIPFKFPREYLKFHPLSEVHIPPNHYRPSLLPTVAWAHWTDIRQRSDIAALNLSFPYGPMPDKTTTQIVQHYNAAVSYIDDMVGGVLKAALGEDIAGNNTETIVVLTADHGWSLGEHGEFGKYSNFEVATKVPLIIFVPGLTNGESIDVRELTELVDIFPTLVDLTHVSDSLKICSKNQNSQESILCTEGQSLVPLMVSKIIYSKKLKDKISPITKVAVFSQYPRYSNFSTLRPNNDKPRLKNIHIMGYSIRTKNYRYTEWVRFDNIKFKPAWNRVYGKELYDHTIDPDENMNLVDRNEMQNIVHELRHKLKQGWRHAISF